MRTLPLTFALALLLAMPASAHHCATWTTSNAIAAGDHYVYDACVEYATTGQAGMECAMWGPWDVWVYEESNGIPGLQRGDEILDDTCHGLIRADTIIF